MTHQDGWSRRDFVRLGSAGVASAMLLGCDSENGPEEPVSAGQDSSSDSREGWDEIADAALRAIRKSGADYGDIRILRTRRQRLHGQDGRLADVSDGLDAGLGIRVLFKGAWGFAATCAVDPGSAREMAKQAFEIARASASLQSNPIHLVPEPVHKDTVATPRKIDPLAVPLDKRAEVLLKAMDVMKSQQGIRRCSASLWCQRDLKLFSSTEGSHLYFDLLANQGGINATAVKDGHFASREFMTPYLRTGYELIQEADLVGQAERVARQALEKTEAPQVEPGPYDLLLDPLHLALTIHESCGHATELDRALGYEANFAGTSFLTTEKLGTFRYGSKHVNLVADNTEPETLAATGYDDDGVACQKWDIVRDGLFVGYSDNREVASRIGGHRSRGSNHADSWGNVPIVRIPNIGLQPGEATPEQLLSEIKKGIFIEGHGSFSIDQERYNFQFGGDAFWLIENGKKKHMLRDVIYHGITPEFWASCDGVAGPAHRKKYGFISCGKGQPMQSGWMTHAAAPARFREVQVIRGGKSA